MEKNHEHRQPLISVIMPTFNQGAFISRAIESLQLQRFADWELIIILDGCTDYTLDIVKQYCGDTRIKYFLNEENEGLGKAINRGLNTAVSDLIAYLPSDDVYFRNHLEVLYSTLQSSSTAVMAYSGMRFHYNDSARAHTAETTYNEAEGYLQLVQVLHRKTEDRWMERTELATDNLNVMFWNILRHRSIAVPTNTITCEWVAHPLQHHKLIRESMGGGIMLYKNHYNIKKPVRFQSSVGNLIDETFLYKQFRKKTANAEKLKILLVGELAYNPERIFALEEYGHRLYGLWISNPDFYNTIGPLPFGNVEDIPLYKWRSMVSKIKPDVIYALLNYHSISLAHHVMLNNPGIPFVWHFKEGPFYARQHGLWKELIELYANSDGQIFPNEETREWFAQFITLETPTLILDGDLPKKEWFTECKSRLLSEQDGEIHTVMPGRPLGVTIEDISNLKQQKIHFHLYGEFFQTVWKPWIAEASKAGERFFHLHPHCPANEWVKELSQYDAGWLHAFESNNNGEMMRCTWNDLNYPARMSALAIAGLPMIQKVNNNQIVATQNLSNRLNTGLFYDTIASLSHYMAGDSVQSIRENVWQQRFEFCFDQHVPDLTAFLQEVIGNKINKKNEVISS